MRHHPTSRSEELAVSPRTVDSPHPPSRAAIAIIDVRAQAVLDELAAVQLEHTRAVVQARQSLPRSEAHEESAQRVRDLARAITQLERSLDERPWTET
jgi:hypothetical protein